MDNKPNPGSNEALAIGCTCPVLDNARGNGAWGGVEINGSKVFYYSGNCPVHRAEHDECVEKLEGRSAA